MLPLNSLPAGLTNAVKNVWLNKIKQGGFYKKDMKNYHEKILAA